MALKEDINLMTKLYTQIPAFTDVFEEHTFYIFAFCVTIGSIILAFILSRFITIKAVD